MASYVESGLLGKLRAFRNFPWNVLSKWKSATPCSSSDVERAGLVETFLDVQFCTPLSAKDAVDRGEFRVGEVFIFNLSWTVGGVH